MTTSINDLSVDTMADNRPLPKAVKYPEIKTLKPMNKNIGLNIFRPYHVMSNTCPFSTKI